MAEEKGTTNQNPADMSELALKIAKDTGFGTDETKFKAFEKEFIKKFYEIIGLSDIPDEFLTFGRFVDAYSSILVKSVQNDLAIMNLTKRLAMFKLSGEIQNTAQQAQNESESKPTFVPPIGKTKV